MSKNRQQLKTGLRAILGGGLREEPAAVEEMEPAAPASEPAPAIVPAPVPAVVPAPVEIVATPALSEVMAAVQETQDEGTSAAVVEERARKQRKRPAPAPVVESKPKMAPALRVGTLENPYVRKRDNLPTRKVGIVLPVALAERMQIHCVKARTRPNEFVARAIEELLDELQA
jgi:hypothetical protein